MDSRGARQLRDAHDRVLDIARRHHHEIGELVDDDEQIGVGPQHALTAERRREFARAHGLVEVIDVTEAKVREVVVAVIHLLDDPLQRVCGLLGIGDDRRDEVRDALVGRELHALGVHEDHADFVGRGAHENRRDERVDAARLASSRGPRHQQVRHLGEVGHDIATLHVLAERHRHRVVFVGRRARAQHVAEAHKLSVGVGDLDADRTLAGDGAEDAHLGTRHGVGDVATECRHSLDLDTRPEFDLVSRDGRAAREARDPRVDVELLEHLRERGDDGIVGLGACARSRAGLECAGIG